MTIATKTLQSGFSMPIYGIGTWMMGGKAQRDITNDDKADIAAIRSAVEHGVSFVDTAEKYADTYTEELVGRALEGIDRSQVFLVTKVSPVRHPGYDAVVRSCHESLKRLNTNYVDLFLLHEYVPETLEGSLRALDDLVREGSIRSIGVCNFGPRTLHEARGMTSNKIVYDQVHYNLAYREPEHSGLLRYCQENDVILGAWRPTQKGMLSAEVPAVVEELAAKYSRTPVQIALNWLISQKNVTTLSKTTTLAHLEENLGALDWTMEDIDIERLRSEYPHQKVVSDAVPLDTLTR